MATRKVDYLLIGGGLASANCARWLREEGAEGEVLLVGREPDAPYNRPECSKGYLRGEESREEPLFRPAGVVGRAGDRAADAHERDRARPRDTHGDAVEQGAGRVRTGADRDGREREAAERGGVRAPRDPLPADTGKRGRDQGEREGRRERGADRGLVHRLRGRGEHDDDRQAGDGRDAGGADAGTGVREGGRAVRGRAAGGARRDGPRRATSWSASRGRAAWRRWSRAAAWSWRRRRS